MRNEMHPRRLLDLNDIHIEPLAGQIFYLYPKPHLLFSYGLLTLVFQVAFRKPSELHKLVLNYLIQLDKCYLFMGKYA